jgi:hypothetical protein
MSELDRARVRQMSHHRRMRVPSQKTPAPLIAKTKAATIVFADGMLIPTSMLIKQKAPVIGRGSNMRHIPNRSHVTICAASAKDT